MTATLAELIDRLEAELKDSGNSVWSATELTAHIRRALGQVSQAAPRLLDALLETADGVYEYSLAELDGFLWLTDCWYPWDPAAPTCPAPRPARWGLVKERTLGIVSDTRPDGAAEHRIRVFYCAAHTIAGLDGAEAGTLDATTEDLVLLGASAYAALQRSQDGVTRVWPGAGAVEQLSAWGEQRLAHYNAALEALRRHNVLAGDARREIR